MALEEIVCWPRPTAVRLAVGEFKKDPAAAALSSLATDIDGRVAAGWHPAFGLASCILGIYADNRMNNRTSTGMIWIAPVGALLLTLSSCSRPGLPPNQPTGLGVAVRPKGPQMEAEFTNHSPHDLAILLGNQKCRLAPGKTGKLLFENQQPLKVAEMVPGKIAGDDRPRLRIESVVSPRAARYNLMIPNG